MILTVSEIQNIIDDSNSDIDKIFENKENVTSIIDDHNRFSFNKTFVKRFFYDSAEKIYDLVPSTVKMFKPYTDTISDIINTLNYDESDWDNHVKAALQFIKYDKKHTYVYYISYMFILFNKNSAYLSYLIKNKDKIISEFNLKTKHPYLNSDTVVVSKGSIDKLQESEKLKVLNTLAEISNVTGSPYKIDPDIEINALFKNLEDFVTYATNEDAYYYDLLKEQSVETVIEILTILLDKGISMTINVGSILRVFIDNAYIIDDELAERLINTWLHNSDIVPVISREKITEHFPSVNPKQLIKNPTISIDDLPNLTTIVDNILGSRFFREEEMIENPKYFDPTELSSSAYAYVSEETYRVINKSWNMNRRYNTDLSDFKAIISTNIMNASALSVDNIKYLVKKCKPTNSEVLNSIITLNKHSKIDNRLVELANVYKSGKE